IKAVSNSETLSITLNASAATAGITTVDISAGTKASGNVVDASAYTTTHITILGAAGSNTLTGGAFSDTITGGAASDTIDGSAGNDSIVGGAGSDQITGGLGADNLTGGADVDTFVITAVDTSIDTITDWNVGGTQDLISTAYTAAGQLNITIANDAGNVGTLNLATVLGSAGAVASVIGGAGSDNITGGSGADTISGGAGADTISGGDGADSITGGAGVDIINGGNGIDKFITGSIAADADEITGFVKGGDILDLSAALTPVTLTIGTQVAYTATKATNIAAVITAANTDTEVYYIANTAGGTGVMSLTEIETAITAGSAATGQATIIIDNGTSTFIYTDQDANADAGAGAGLILQATLIGITGATALATGDLISV
ncbi:MAG: hypothetical protein NTZ45_03580, partial [Methylococcales bacterium]|nr:hypothetical protein [Methylococcales bacterium]